MGYYHYFAENECFEKEKEKCEEKKEEREENNKEKHCDSESANALKRILELLDCLNKEDLYLLDKIIDRLLCIRSKDC